MAKEDGQIRMYDDFRDSNKISLMDDFPLTNMDLLVDNKVRHHLWSFMNHYTYCNQIKMIKEDQKKTFHYAIGHLLLNMMSFNLIDTRTT